MIDPELAALLDFMPVIDLDDPVAARAAFEKLLVSMRTPLPEAELLDIEDRMIPGWEDDPGVSVRVYRPKAAAGTGEASPGIVLIHGGGFIVGSVEAEHVGAVLMALDAGAVLVSVDYRLAPEHPYPAGLHDCYAALSFLHAEASALGVDPARIALVGTSAGGGLGAATALLARDRGGPAICFQMLHIPELDDRLETPSMQQFVDAPVWNTPLAVQSWKAYLGDLAGTDDIPAYAAPARATDLSGLPPAYVSTAENDPLRDEGIAYALALLRAGVSVELHQFPGTFHGSALVARAAVSRRAQKEAAAVLRRALGVVEQ
ncbi:MAG TPA: alpha/beta hydrolase [Acidimicrobiales bacterium]|jgi:acetyl esterase/lipase